MRQKNKSDALQRIEVWEERVSMGDVFTDLAFGAFLFVCMLEITSRLSDRLAFWDALRPNMEVLILAALWLVMAFVGYFGLAWPCYTHWMYCTRRAIHLRIKGSLLDVMCVLGMLQSTQDEIDGIAKGLPFFFCAYTDWQFKKTKTRESGDGNVVAYDVYGYKRK